MPDASVKEPVSATGDGRQVETRGAALGRFFFANPNPHFVLAAYTATTFLSALLLFSVQPMFAKMVLPVLGGSPSVWAVAIFFFQAALLIGYCYAHLLIAKASPLPHRYHPSCRMQRGLFGFADRTAERLDRAAGRRALPVANRPLHGGDRPAVSGRCRQRPLAAGVVRAHRTRPSRRSLLSLRGEQSRQLDSPAELPVHPRAGLWSQGPEPVLGGRLRAVAGGPRLGLCADAGPRRACSQSPRGRFPWQSRRRRAAHVVGSAWLDRPGAGTGGAAHRLHHPRHHRYRFRTAALGVAAFALSADLCAWCSASGHCCRDRSCWRPT